MYQGKLRKITLILLALYTVIIFYFLFLGFNRTQDDTLRYSLIPDGIPLHFPMGDSYYAFFELGNFVGFLPFGVVIPLLFRCTFIRFIALFILSITTLEVLQMLSLLGSLDIDDIILNTLGAAVGFWAQRFVRRDRDKFKGMRRIVLTASVLSVGVYAILGGINNYLDNGGGDTVALNELASTDGSVLWDQNLLSFTALHKKVEPQINLYSRKNAKDNEFTNPLNGKYTRISGKIVIPDEVVDNARKGVVELAFIVDGTPIYSLQISGMKGSNDQDSFEVPLNGANELTLKLMNKDPNSTTNAVMWDVTLTEVNAGQRVVNRMKEN